MTTSRVPVTAHTDQFWRIHDLAPDFRIEDVWRFRTPGAGPADFPLMLDVIAAAGQPEAAGPIVRALFAIRWKLGELFGWDGDTLPVESNPQSLFHRLPADLRRPTGRPVDPTVPLDPLYELTDESALELVNKTAHAICHLGWVPVGGGEYGLQMAVLVKTGGPFSAAYMAAIRPFRHLIVYPALARQWERAWRDRAQVAS